MAVDDDVIWHDSDVKTEPVLRPGQGERPKLATLITKDIRHRVEAAGWPVGLVLGSEVALARRYGVSKSVIREASRLLEHQEVATMKRGPLGGLTVSEPTVEAVVDAIAVMFDYSGVSFRELVQIQALLERWSARTAAERVTEDAVRELERTASEDEVLLGLRVFTERHSELHTAIARKTGNPVATMLVTAVTSLLVRYTRPALAHDASPDDTSSTIERVHAGIVAAIRAGDPESAERRMGKHIAGMSEWLAAAGGERAEWTDLDLQQAVRTSENGKLAEIVAERIRDEILADGWRVGSLLGTEPALLSRYRVSRAVFREAVRLLEHHSVVAFRAGNNGGLVVAQPHSGAIVEAALRYLRYHSVEQRHLAEMRVALEACAAALAAARAATAEMSALARHLGPRDAEREVRPCTGWFHVVLGQLSGNRALALVIETLIEIQIRLSSDDGRNSASVPGPDQVTAHSTVLAAVLAGRADTAGESIRTHLTATP